MIISLKEYKDEVIYFSLFDILIKKVGPNRDIYLEDIDRVCDIFEEFFKAKM